MKITIKISGCMLCLYFLIIFIISCYEPARPSATFTVQSDHYAFDVTKIRAKLYCQGSAISLSYYLDTIQGNKSAQWRNDSIDKYRGKLLTFTLIAYDTSVIYSDTFTCELNDYWYDFLFSTSYCGPPDYERISMGTFLFGIFDVACLDKRITKNYSY